MELVLTPTGVIAPSILYEKSGRYDLIWHSFSKNANSTYSSTLAYFWAFGRVGKG